MQVPIGPATILGYLTFLAGELVAGVVAVTGTESQLHGPGKWAGLGGLLALLVTNHGRQNQGAALARAQGADEGDDSTTDHVALSPLFAGLPAADPSAIPPDEQGATAAR